MVELVEAEGWVIDEVMPRLSSSVFHTVLNRDHLQVSSFLNVIRVFKVALKDTSFTKEAISQGKLLVAHQEVEASVCNFFADTGYAHDVVRGHLLLRFKVCVTESLRVDYISFDSVNHGKPHTISRQNKIIPESVVQVLVVEAFILSVLGAFHRVVEHGAVTALLWLILVQRPSQDADAIINAV